MCVFYTALESTLSYDLRNKNIGVNKICCIRAVLRTNATVVGLYAENVLPLTLLIFQIFLSS